MDERLPLAEGTWHRAQTWQRTGAPSVAPEEEWYVRFDPHGYSILATWETQQGTWVAKHTCVERGQRHENRERGDAAIALRDVLRRIALPLPVGQEPQP